MTVFEFKTMRTNAMKYIYLRQGQHKTRRKIRYYVLVIIGKLGKYFLENYLEHQTTL